MYWLPLKSIEFNGVDTTGFLKNFLVLTYLFVFVDFLRSYCVKKNPIDFKKLIDNRNLSNDTFSFFYGFSLDTFLAHFILI